MDSAPIANTDSLSGDGSSAAPLRDLQQPATDRRPVHAESHDEMNSSNEQCPLVPEVNDPGASVNVPVRPMCKTNSTDRAVLHQCISGGPRSIKTEVFAGSRRLESQICNDAKNFVTVLQQSDPRWSTVSRILTTDTASGEILRDATVVQPRRSLFEAALDEHKFILSLQTSSQLESGQRRATLARTTWRILHDSVGGKYASLNSCGANGGREAVCGFCLL